jgi:hypothetical protein
MRCDLQNPRLIADPQVLSQYLSCTICHQHRPRWSNGCGKTSFPSLITVPFLYRVFIKSDNVTHGPLIANGNIHSAWRVPPTVVSPVSGSRKLIHSTWAIYSRSHSNLYCPGDAFRLPGRACEPITAHMRPLVSYNALIVSCRLDRSLVQRFEAALGTWVLYPPASHTIAVLPQQTYASCRLNEVPCPDRMGCILQVYVDSGSACDSDRG